MAEAKTEAMEATLLDLEAVGGMSFDDLEEAPGFVIPADGVYDLLLTTAKIEKYTPRSGDNAGKEQARISHYYEIESVVEMVNKGEQLPAKGSKFSERFQINPDGMKYWKTKAKQILGEGVDGSNLTVGQIIKELSAGTYHFRAKVSNKITEGTGANKGKKFNNVQVRVVEKKAEPSLDGGVAATDPAKV